MVILYTTSIINWETTALQKLASMKTRPDSAKINNPEINKFQEKSDISIKKETFSS